MIKYLGSKRVLVPAIVGISRALPGVRRVLDLFSGTARVGHALKKAGFSVAANDHNAFAHVLAGCYVAADARAVAADARRLLDELRRVPPEDGWFTETYARRARYFRPENAARIEGIRNRIAALALPFELESVLLTALLEAADRVDSTVGVQMAYLKSWAPRARRPLELRMPEVLPGRGEAHRLEAVDAASLPADLAYLDPPYNQHSYLGNYHVWETLVLWDHPEVYGKACKRSDCRTRKSPFNRKREIRAALAQLLERTAARHLVLSFNDEGFLEPAEIEALLARRGPLIRLEIPYRRYVGARIGIHDPQGRKVGRPGRLANTEILWVSSPDREALAGLGSALPAPVEALAARDSG